MVRKKRRALAARHRFNTQKHARTSNGTFVNEDEERARAAEEEWVPEVFSDSEEETDSEWENVTDYNLRRLVVTARNLPRSVPARYTGRSARTIRHNKKKQSEEQEATKKVRWECPSSEISCSVQLSSCFSFVC
jgi:hypothetical protein